MVNEAGPSEEPNCIFWDEVDSTSGETVFCIYTVRKIAPREELLTLYGDNKAKLPDSRCADADIIAAECKANKRCFYKRAKAKTSDNVLLWDGESVRTLRKDSMHRRSHREKNEKKQSKLQEQLHRLWQHHSKASTVRSFEEHMQVRSQYDVGMRRSNASRRLDTFIGKRKCLDNFWKGCWSKGSSW